MRTRVIPQLQFLYDTTAEKGALSDYYFGETMRQILKEEDDGMFSIDELMEGDGWEKGDDDIWASRQCPESVPTRYLIVRQDVAIGLVSC